jgi:hypothetical protein
MNLLAEENEKGKNGLNNNGYYSTMKEIVQVRVIKQLIILSRER